MLRRTLVVAVAAVSVLLILAAMVLPTPEEVQSSGPFASALDLYFLFAFGLLVSGLATVGLLVAIHRPDHPIGWLFLASSFLTSFSIFGGGLSELVERGGGDPAFGIILLPTSALAPRSVSVWLRPRHADR